MCDTLRHELSTGAQKLSTGCEHFQQGHSRISPANHKDYTFYKICDKLSTGYQQAQT
jgi:hypothetical protein